MQWTPRNRRIIYLAIIFNKNMLVVRIRKVEAPLNARSWNYENGLQNSQHFIV